MIWPLQTLRFVAAAMVVFIHAAQTALRATGSAGSIPHEMVGLGLVGVDIFFVISGVVIATTAPGLSPSQFAWRRICRIVPLYLICCIPAVLVALPNGIGWREVVATFLLWPATDVMTPPLLEVAWTLSFEMVFYAGAALALAGRRWLFLLLGLYAAAFSLRSSSAVFQFLGNPLIIEFLFGVAIARAPGMRGGVAALPLGVALLLTAGLLHLAPAGGTLDFLQGGHNLRRVIVCGIPAALIVYGAMQVRAGRSVWTYLGDASYALYLVHTFIVTPLQALWIRYPIPADAIIAIDMAASIVLAWRVHEVVEKPILNRLRQWRNRTARDTDRMPRQDGLMKPEILPASRE